MTKPERKQLKRRMKLWRHHWKGVRDARSGKYSDGGHVGFLHRDDADAALSEGAAADAKTTRDLFDDPDVVRGYLSAAARGRVVGAPTPEQLLAASRMRLKPDAMKGLVEDMTVAAVLRLPSAQQKELAQRLQRGERPAVVLGTTVEPRTAPAGSAPVMTPELLRFARRLGLEEVDPEEVEKNADAMRRGFGVEIQFKKPAA